MNTGSDIYTKLKADHASAAGVLQRLADTDSTNTAQRKTLFAELKHSLTKHSEAEDEVVYAELLKHDATRDLIRDGQQEHQRIESLLHELERMDTADPQWGIRLQTLKGVVEHHVHEEENRVFPRAQTLLTSQQAEDLGRQFTQAKARETVSQAQDTAASVAPETTAKAQEAGERMSHEAQRLAGEAKERGSSMLRNQQHFIASQIESIAGALHKTSQQLGTENQGALAQYTDQAAEGLERFSHSLRDQDFDTMVGQVEDFARRQPTVFIGSAALVGFLAARFLKSSAERRHATAGYPAQTRESVTGSPTGSAASPTSSPAAPPAPGSTTGTASSRESQSPMTHGGN